MATGILLLMASQEKLDHSHRVLHSMVHLEVVAKMPSLPPLAPKMVAKEPKKAPTTTKGTQSLQTQVSPW